MAKVSKTVESIKPVYSYLNADGSLTKLALQQLKNPFPPDEVTFKPTDVKKDKGTCLALAYADKRTYEERLDQVFGIQNWSEEITKIETVPYRKIRAAKRKDWKDPNSDIITPEEVTEGHRVMVVVRISVNGLCVKESGGVTESADENSITTAEAQAFKRACSMLHVGKYLYFLPRYECKYSYGKIQDPPQLPDWAIPTTYCEDCSDSIKTTQFKDKDNNVLAWNPIEITKRSQTHFGKNLCMDCMKKRKEANPPAAAKRLKKEEETQAESQVSEEVSTDTVKEV